MQSPTSTAPPSTAADAAPSVSTLSIAALALGAFGSGMSLRVNDALLPRLAGEFAIPLAQAAQVVSVFAIAYGLAQLFFGPLGDRYGKYRVVAWGCAACALAAMLCGLAPGFTALRALRALAGVTAAAIIPLSMAWIGDVVPYENRQPVLARFLIGQILGLSAGVWLGGIAADHLGWRVPYFILALLFSAVAVVLFMVERGLPAHARTRRPGSGSALARIAGDFRHVLAQRWARVVLVSVFLEAVALYGPFAFIAAHLHERFGLTLSAAGSVLMLFGMGGFVFALGAGRLVARLGEVGLARWGGATMAASMALVAFAPHWLWALPGCLGMGLGFYMLHNTLQVNATQMAPQRRGPAVSAFASLFFLGQSAGVVLAGWLMARWGSTATIALGAAGVLAVAWGFGALRAGREG
ncbi:MFS transporter [Azohydromonas caseinilytica]|uniref:MFS transporter n=1 Tax=Azohydromonas caseinilytica TaxID=2728836 RepID=A0A848FAS4_9BURK|nr:MFS transporter [Azohydromonas caseinilytica]NML15855.1 MFS transporter [Azohydromonas caseinilytica]